MIQSLAVAANASQVTESFINQQATAASVITATAEEVSEDTQFRSAVLVNNLMQSATTTGQQLSSSTSDVHAIFLSLFS